MDFFGNDKLTFKRVFNYLLGLWFITLGIGFSIKSNLGATPVSSIPYTLNLIWGIEINMPFSKTKVVYDVSLLVISVVLCFVFLGVIGGSIGIGTILSAVFVGTVLKYIHKLNSYLTGKTIDFKQM